PAALHRLGAVAPAPAALEALAPFLVLLRDPRPAWILGRHTPRRRSPVGALSRALLRARRYDFIAHRTPFCERSRRKGTGQTSLTRGRRRGIGCTRGAASAAGASGLVLVAAAPFGRATGGEGA